MSPVAHIRKMVGKVHFRKAVFKLSLLEVGWDVVFDLLVNNSLIGGEPITDIISV